jgi:hypothetical protein
MKKVLCLLTLTAVSSLTVFSNTTPKFEASRNYSYMQFYLTVTGLQSRTLNGGVFQVNFALFVTASPVSVMDRV